jgi:hypothetical protein
MHRRRRLTAFLALTILVAGVGAAIAAGNGSSGSNRPRAGVGTSRTRATSTQVPAASRTQTSPQRPRPNPQASPTAYRVGMTSLMLTEPATAATATGHTASGAPVRTLPTIVRYPAAGTPGSGAHPGAAPASGHGPFPLVIFSQG